MSTKELVEFVVEGRASAFEDTLKSMLDEKSGAAIDAKIDSMYGQIEEESDEDEDEDNDDSDDADDADDSDEDEDEDEESED